MDEQPEEVLHGIGLMDHSITSEYRIFGPPGTGKTSSLTHLIECAVNRFGANSVLATSFSKAAAAELVGKNAMLDSGTSGRCIRIVIALRKADDR